MTGRADGEIEELLGQAAGSGHLEIMQARRQFRSVSYSLPIYRRSVAKKKKVLFVCVHNSFRSQMAEAWLNHICGDEFEAQSGGLESGVVGPLAIEAMSEVGIDISHKRTRKVFDVWKTGVAFAYVITVCSEAERSARACPIFPGVTVKMSWPFPDPSGFQGSEADRLEQARQVRDAIRARIEDWCAEVCSAETSVV